MSLPGSRSGRAQTASYSAWNCRIFLCDIIAGAILYYEGALSRPAGPYPQQTGSKRTRSAAMSARAAGIDLSDTGAASFR